MSEAPTTTTCGLTTGWEPPCPNRLPCERHPDERYRCRSCDRRAIRLCAESSSLMCGAGVCPRHGCMGPHGRSSISWTPDDFVAERRPSVDQAVLDAAKQAHARWIELQNVEVIDGSVGNAARLTAARWAHIAAMEVLGRALGEVQ